ncbi:MAG: class II aldolase/adducin family protein [Pyrinomonadaceae bacterium]|nr:class II aldolase/adducin family protein [Pyrinomonadaceae bacterium]MBP6213100.1 class II aldolase/adducin family protein [Pyrinomonadaceae bacterium]
MDESQARKLIVEVGKLLYERSYVVAFDGNVSIRLDENTVLATPTMTSKGRMTEECLALTDMDGKPLSDKRASSELAMHLLIYKMRPDIHAVCHAHPAHGTAFAVAGLAIDKPILSEVVLTLGCVPLTGYGTPSTDELTEAMKPYVPHHNALLMANHGAVAYGEHLWQAFDRLETLEHTAKIAILAKALGGANDLPEGAVEKLIEIREKAGFLGTNARCQACGYLHESGIVCDLDVSYPVQSASAGAKISLSREELIELLSQAANLS